MNSDGLLVSKVVELIEASNVQGRRIEDIVTLLMSALEILKDFDSRIKANEKRRQPDFSSRPSGKDIRPA